MDNFRWCSGSTTTKPTPFRFQQTKTMVPVLADGGGILYRADEQVPPSIATVEMKAIGGELVQPLTLLWYV